MFPIQKKNKHICQIRNRPSTCFEPLLGKIHPSFTEFVDWAIIGAQSPYSEKTFPKWEWVKEIIEACDKASIPLFLKNNLRLPKLSCEGGMPFYKRHPSGTMELRQEFPKGC